MARTRNLKPAFFKNEHLAALDPLVRLLFSGLWGVADRVGLLEDRPKRIKAEVLPYDDCDVDTMLQTLADSTERFIVRYVAEDQKLIVIPSFLRHQSPHKAEQSSILPSPPIEVAPEWHSVSTLQARNKHSSCRALTLNPSTLTLNPSIDIGCIAYPDGFDTPKVRDAIIEWLAYKAARKEAYKDPAKQMGQLLKTKDDGQLRFTTPQEFIDAVGSSMGANYAGCFPGGRGDKTQSRQGRDPRYAD